jgi:hypothetical protein
VRPHLRVFPSHPKTGAFLRRSIPRGALRVIVSRRRRQELARHLHTAQPLGKWPAVKDLRAMRAVTAGQSGDDVARTLGVTPKTVQQWWRRWLVAGRHGWHRKTSPGRPPKRTNARPHALAKLLDAGPVQAGLTSAGGRAPLIPPVLYARLGVFYHVCSIAP